MSKLCEGNVFSDSLYIYNTFDSWVGRTIFALQSWCILLFIHKNAHNSQVLPTHGHWSKLRVWNVSPNQQQTNRVTLFLLHRKFPPIHDKSLNGMLTVLRFVVCVCNVFLMVCMFFAVPQESLSEKIKALKQQKLPRHVGIHDKIKFQFRFKLHHSTS